MSIRVALDHVNHYQYDRPIRLSPHVLRLRPAPHSRTPVTAYSLTVRPEKHFINWQQDAFGNWLARLVFPEPSRELYIQVDLHADLTVINPFDFFVEDYAQHYPFAYPPELSRDLAPYCQPREDGPRLQALVASIDRSPARIVDFLVSLNRQLCQAVGYVIRLEPGVQSCEQTLTLGTGSCRDSAWLLVQLLRHLGLAARFVSGYLIQLTADQKSLDGPSGPSQDFTDLHAWTEVYVPGAGWIGLDPTSGLFAGEGHIPLACAPDYESAAAVTGATDVCESEFSYHNRVTRIFEDPRVTLPYSEQQWAAAMALGQAVDEELQAGDVRLTQGGEPTFVSIDDMDSPQWNTDALGSHKRQLAGDLLRRLRDEFAPGGLLTYSQGKWYPGEPLPRWALTCHWRQDGAPIWQDPRLLAHDQVDYHQGVAEAHRYAAALAQRLGVDDAQLVAGYEDTLYYLWKEGSTPINLDPATTRLDDPAERQRLAELLQRGLASITGYALPLRWQAKGDHGHWQSGSWTFRRGSMYLLPGDSPMGYRLPLDALPWLAPEQREIHHERSLFETPSPFGDLAGEVARRYGQWTAEAGRPDFQPQYFSQPHDIPHTALCVEPREGRLRVFLPPVPSAEAWLDLITSLEATSAELNLPIQIEGYPPPRDPRLQQLQVTPDPGVIEVNVQPTRQWNELVRLTETLYEAARLSRLGTEKFMLDGRHTGTGGGNHITLGAANPADSPFLRRPELLGSLVTYWQHHPSLSYLFSGLFIGPTSQAPRIDEARNEALYELEIALARLPDGEVPAPWLVDRLLRHLLTDLTGNTHRAEFCIDKLYSPDSATGRLGLLEMRAYEMPPHARMSLMQSLLLRALVARFWKTPYRQPLVRWGTAIHDRWMLPHYLWADLQDVVCELRAAGYAFELEWFAPFLEFRFPRYGTVQYGDVSLELRLAVEPWHVLGEEVTGQGTARYVDSSVERVQVKVNGLTPSRYAVTGNGRRLPLHPTGRHGEYVAGVRYRAWQPPSALHPTIGVHAPLVFDVVDLWQNRALGGCTYHVSHPGGRSYDTFPVNSNEAEARRLARFWPYGHHPGPVTVPAEEPSDEYPYTLDLRRGRSC